MVTTGESQSETITISNPGGQPLTINQAALGGANASEFSIVSGQDNCSGQTVPENGSCTVTVAFAATANGADGDSVVALRRWNGNDHTEPPARASPRRRGCPRSHRNLRRRSSRLVRSSWERFRQLIWRAGCQEGRQEFLALEGGRGGRGVVGWVGSGPAGWARRAVRLIYAGLGCRRTMVRRGEPLSKFGRGRPCGRVAHSYLAGSPRVAGPPPTQPTGWAMCGLVATRFG